MLDRVSFARWWTQRQVVQGVWGSRHSQLVLLAVQSGVSAQDVLLRVGELQLLLSQSMGK